MNFLAARKFLLSDIKIVLHETVEFFW